MAYSSLYFLDCRRRRRRRIDQPFYDRPRSGERKDEEPKSGKYKQRPKHIAKKRFYYAHENIFWEEMKNKALKRQSVQTLLHISPLIRFHGSLAGFMHILLLFFFFVLSILFKQTLGTGVQNPSRVAKSSERVFLAKNRMRIHHARRSRR